MALYKLDDTGEAKRIELNEYMRWRTEIDTTCLIIARHEIIEHERLGALAIEIKKGTRHNSKVLAAVITKMCANTDSDNDPPWEIVKLEEGKEELMASCWDRGDALKAHIGTVNMMTGKKGGRVLIRH
jgi:hypothetical protein